MFILNSQQIAAADQATIKSNNISSIDLMERAAKQCYNWLHNQLQNQNIKIHVFCGIGNNGGDGCFGYIILIVIVLSILSSIFLFNITYNNENDNSIIIEISVTFIFYFINYL